MAKVYIAFPVAMSGKIDIRMIQLLIQAQEKYEVIIGCEIGHQIAHNRNRLIKKFLETDCEWKCGHARPPASTSLQDGPYRATHATNAPPPYISSLF